LFELGDDEMEMGGAVPSSPAPMRSFPHLVELDDEIERLLGAPAEVATRIF
jgi:hypothetical protein